MTPDAPARTATAPERRCDSTWRGKLASVLSEVLSPFVVLAAVLLLVGLLTDPNWLLSTSVSAGLICGVPLLLSLVMTRRGLVSDRFILHRHQRHAFYALTLTSLVAGAALMQILPTGQDMRLVSTLAVGTLLAVMVINAWIKISIHALAAAIMAVVLPAALPYWPVVPSAVLAWLSVSWSRVYLDRHQVIDVSLGSALGGAVGLVFLALAEGLPTPA